MEIKDYIAKSVDNLFGAVERIFVRTESGARQSFFTGMRGIDKRGVITVLEDTVRMRVGKITNKNITDAMAVIDDVVNLMLRNRYFPYRSIDDILWDMEDRFVVYTDNNEGNICGGPGISVSWELWTGKEYKRIVDMDERFARKCFQVLDIDFDNTREWIQVEFCFRRNGYHKTAWIVDEWADTLY